MSLAQDLEKGGFDAATAHTIAELAHGRSINDARELLSSVLGPENPILATYIQQRETTELEKLNKKLRNVTIKHEKQRAAKPRTAKISAAEKNNALKDIEAAMQSLTHNAPGRRACECAGLKHGVLESAPNCLSCGRVVCTLEGLGPCLFCKSPLVPNEQLEQIRAVLEKQQESILATMSRKALIAAGVDPSAYADLKSMFASTQAAEEHLERTLGFQAEDAERTKIVDRVSDIDVVTPGASQWATPAEQAEQLRQQQRQLRIQKEKELQAIGRGRKVLSIDIRGNKIYQVEQDAPIDDLILAAEEDEVLIAEKISAADDEDANSEQYFEPAKFGKVQVFADSEKAQAAGAARDFTSVDMYPSARRVISDDHTIDTADPERDQPCIIHDSNEILQV